MSSPSFSVAHIAQLASIPITPDQEKKLTQAFTETLAVVDELKTVDTHGVAPTYQVTGQTNVLRDDVVDEDRMFTQTEAISQARKSWRGFIVVPPVLPSNQTS